MKPSDPSGGVLGTTGYYSRARVDFGCLLLPADKGQEVIWGPGDSVSHYPRGRSPGLTWLPKA